MTACLRCGLDGLIGSQIDAASGWCQECLNGPIGRLQQRTSAVFGIPLERLTSNLRFRIPESGTTEQENPMHRVLRWNVPVDDQWHDIGGGPVLHVASRQHYESPGDLVEVWTLEEIEDDGTPPAATLPVMVVGTGHAIPADTYHVGTAVVPAFGLVQSMLRGGQTHIESRAGLVWHVFAKHDEAYRDRLAEEGRRLASLREDLIAEGIDRSELAVPLHPDLLPSHGGFKRGQLVLIDSVNFADRDGDEAVVASLDHDHSWRLWVRIGDDMHDQHATALYVSPDDIVLRKQDTPTLDDVVKDLP